MLTKVKNLYHTDKFSYFIRYFAVFTLIFVLMTAIIFQLMRATMFQNSDNNFKKMADDSMMVVSFALARDLAPGTDVVIEKEEGDGAGEEDEREIPRMEASLPPSKIRLNTNYHIVLYDEEGAVLNHLDYYSGLSGLDLDKQELGVIHEKSITSPLGDQEEYRCMTIEIDSKAIGQYSSINVKYATIFLNVTQLKTSIANYEQTVIIVMISFWVISIVASIYLSNLSMRPILASFQKQKDFVENASHELRTPLAVLQNRLESLFRHPEATIMDSSENIASSLEEVRNMRLLTSNLLNLARRDDGLKPELVETSPSFIDEVFENYRMMAEESGKQFVATNSIQQSFRTDKVLLKQLLTILFDNAMKYSDEDGKIEWTATIRDRHLIFAIADNGLGIKTEDKRKIFDRFYRVDKARTRQKGGFGLGLSLAKQIIDTLKGSITVRDNQPKGTIFEVRLPR